MTGLELTDHLGSVASLISLPLTIAGLIVSIFVSWSVKMPIRKILLFTLFGLAALAYGYDVYDRLITDHRYKYQFGADRQLEEIRDKEFG